MIGRVMAALGWRGLAALLSLAGMAALWIWLASVTSARDQALAERDAARLEASLLAETARRNAAAVDAVQRAAARDMEAITAAHAARLARLARQTETGRLIDATPATRACADSPAVRLVLDRLRQPAGDGAGSADRP